MTDKLSDLIDEMVREKTFSLDALDAVKGLRDRAQAQDAQIEKLAKMVTDRDDTIGAGRAQVAELSAKLTAFQAREADLAAREGKARDLELKEAAATAKADALGSVFGTIFRNVTVRETATRALPFSNPQPGGGVFSGVMPGAETMERTSE